MSSFTETKRVPMQCNGGSEETRKSNHHLGYRCVTAAGLAECHHPHGNWFLMPSKIARIHSSHFMLSDCQGGLIMFDSSGFKTWTRIQNNTFHWTADNTNAKRICETLKTSWYCNCLVNISLHKQPLINHVMCQAALFCVISYTHNTVCAL